MKRILLIGVVAILVNCAYASPITIYPGLTLEENNGTYYIHFEMPQWEVVTDTFHVFTSGTPSSPFFLGHAPGEYYFSRIQPTGSNYFDYMSEEGLPELPFYSLDLLLPSDGGGYFNIDDAQIMDSVVIELPYDYTPAQDEYDFYNDFAYDAYYYNSFNNSWHSDSYVADTIQYRFMKGINFSIFPCHYEPSTKSLTIIKEATFEISYKGTFLIFSELQNMLELDRTIYFFFDNFKGFPSPYPIVNNDDYLIITTDEWTHTAALQDFIDHKTSLGYNVEKKSLSEIGDTKEQIRKFIQNKYKSGDAKFVLLVGDVYKPGAIDSLVFSDGIELDKKDPPTDMYYSCLSKDNVSDQWKDLAPSVFIGRWPVREYEGLRNIVDKTIASDLYLKHVLQHYGTNRVSVFSGSDSSNSYMEDFFYNDCKYIYNNVIQSYSYYSGNLYDGRSVGTTILSLKTCLELSENPTWMFVYSGHGNSQEISSPYYWSYSSIGNVNTHDLDFQPFGFGFACLLGNIYEKNNFARSWISSIDGGVSFLGSTTNASNFTDRYFSRKLFQQLKDKPNMTVGEFVGNAKAKYYNPVKTVWRKWEVKKYILYGDPSLYLFGLNLIYNNTPLNIRQSSQSKEENESLKNITSAQIFTLTGQLMGTYNSQPNIQGLPLGTYIIVYTSNSNQNVKKLIIK